ncbi:MAG: hypothetical protein K0S04_1574 [Herbinix sp.]|nr:hypothetical protein [Herbinix sp.]
MKKFLVVLMAFIMVATGITGTDNQVKAATTTIKVVENQDLVANPGQTTHFKVQIIAEGEFIALPKVDFVASGDKTVPFTCTTPYLTQGNSQVLHISNAVKTNLEFDVKMSDTAAIGTYPVNVRFRYDHDNDTETDDLTITITLNIKVTEERTPIQLTLVNASLSNSAIGSDTDLSFSVKNEGEIDAKSVYLTMNYGDFIEESYSAKQIKVGDLMGGANKILTLPVKILSSATAGRKTITANFTYKTPDGEAKTSTYNVTINLSPNTSYDSAPKLVVEEVTAPDSLDPGDTFKIKLNLQNIGGVNAENVVVDVDNTSIDTTGILKGYYTDGITSADTIELEEIKTVTIPLSVSKYATGGLKTIKLVITYTDEKGNAYNLNNNVYVDVKATATSGSTDIVVSNVKQSPLQPKAGEKVVVTFNVKNKGSVTVKDLKLATDGLTSATFIPVLSEPYQYFEELPAGKSVQVKIPLIVSETIVEGVNNITIKYSYSGGDGTVTIPVLNVQNDSVTVSKPKIIVSKYYTDIDELRAGSTFNFTFDLYNTNAKVSAKNITVTIAQADNIFSVTQGSNSFFIEKMNPGETVSQTLEMKVKSDATTKAYPLDITIDYEYDGAEPNPTTGEIGESKTEKLNLQAIENARPVVDNINVYSWDGVVTMGNPAYLSFEFYNMGKSQLNNVVATVEGDFTKSDGNMQFIGNVTAGTSSYVEFEVLPNVEGTASGVLKISYEDSNGDTVEFTKDFTAEIMGAPVIDPGMPGDGSGEVFNPTPAVKAPILPIWLFVIIQVIIFALAVPITRKIIISSYRAKLRKKEEEQY